MCRPRRNFLCSAAPARSKAGVVCCAVQYSKVQWLTRVWTSPPTPAAVPRQAQSRGVHVRRYLQVLAHRLPVPQVRSCKYVSIMTLRMESMLAAGGAAERGGRDSAPRRQHKTHHPEVTINGGRDSSKPGQSMCTSQNNNNSGSVATAEV